MGRTWNYYSPFCDLNLSSASFNYTIALIGNSCWASNFPIFHSKLCPLYWIGALLLSIRKIPHGPYLYFWCALNLLAFKWGYICFYLAKGVCRSVHWNNLENLFGLRWDVIIYKLHIDVFLLEKPGIQQFKRGVATKLDIFTLVKCILFSGCPSIFIVSECRDECISNYGHILVQINLFEW